MKRVAIAGVLSSFVAWAQIDAGLAQGWFLSGSKVSDYEVMTTNEGACGGRAARIRSLNASAKRPVALLQTFRAEDFRGARIRYSATIEAREVEGWAGLLLRVDGINKQTLAFDDMHARPVRGNLKCTTLSAEVEVPMTAESVTLGVRMNGPGDLELSGIEIEQLPTEPSVPGEPLSEVGSIDGLHFNGHVVGAQYTTVPHSFWEPVIGMRSPGVWSDARGDVEARVEGDHLHVRMLSYTIGPTPLLLSGNFTVSRQGAITKIQGNWGTAIASYPASISVSVDRIDMKWGAYERHLQFKEDTYSRDTCRHYEEAGGYRLSDDILLCGAVLSPTPPTVQTVLAFLLTGFRKGTNPWPVPPASTQEIPPPRNR